jgi:hypothetical protein
MHLLCATHTHAPVGALSAQIPRLEVSKRVDASRRVPDLGEGVELPVLAEGVHRRSLGMVLP